MKINILGTTAPGVITPKEEFEKFSGHAAGVCYMKGSFEKLMNESPEKTTKRVAMVKSGGHHSVFDHDFINLELEDIPKALAMVINNEHFYNTSEKSARYTKMVLSPREEELYNKWCGVFQELITNKYKDKFPDFFTDNKITKLAYENARYLISVYTPTTIIYTTSYRQLNALYEMIEREINNPNKSKFYLDMEKPMQDFCSAIKELPYFDETLSNIGRQKRLSLVRPNEEFIEHFGNVYSTKYLGSLAQYAQAQRHRTLEYSFTLLDEDIYYVPPILSINESLIKEWEKDCKSLKEITPQSTMVEIHESGTLEKFILKNYERRCTAAQLEINNQTKATYEKYLQEAQKGGYEGIVKALRPLKIARCTYPEYTCTQPCRFAEGVIETRLI